MHRLRTLPVSQSGDQVAAPGTWGPPRGRADQGSRHRSSMWVLLPVFSSIITISHWTVSDPLTICARSRGRNTIRDLPGAHATGGHCPAYPAPERLHHWNAES